MSGCGNRRLPRGSNVFADGDWFYTAVTSIDGQVAVVGVYGGVKNGNALTADQGRVFVSVDGRVGNGNASTADQFRVVVSVDVSSIFHVHVPGRGNVHVAARGVNAALINIHIAGV